MYFCFSEHRTEQLQLLHELQLMVTYMLLFSLIACFRLFLSPSVSTVGYMLT